MSATSQKALPESVNDVIGIIQPAKATRCGCRGICCHLWKPAPIGSQWKIDTQCERQASRPAVQVETIDGEHWFSVAMCEPCAAYAERAR